MSEHVGQGFPRGALWGAGGLIGLTIALVLGVRTGVVPGPESPPQERVREHVKMVASRSLTFADRADGALIATDTATGNVATTIVPGSNSGFIRGVLRGLARERRMNGIGSGPPFILTQWQDGALTLTDTADGRIIELGSFGGTNRAAFAALLTNAEAPAAPKA